MVPGSGLVKEQAEAEGLDKVFVAAGFEWREPGCSMCLAMNADKLTDGERWRLRQIGILKAVRAVVAAPPGQPTNGCCRRIVWASDRCAEHLSGKGAILCRNLKN